ncbi:MAG: hypothetical protein M1816_004362 [Peltula sp. TS41687]|nr:MAG: hypothetical protein M1816_004362 [Peltula sp. TS41687]
MPLSTLHQIAITLLRSTRPPHHALAKHILLTSSKLGIPEATYFLISEGLRRDRLSQAQLQPALQHLSRLASTGADFRALVLWGQVLVSRRQEQRAMKVLQKVIDKDQITSPNRKDEDEEPESRSPFRISKGTAYTLLASHHLKSKNISLARSLSKFAAEKYDDLEAWLSLAQTQPPASPERERYLTHAATKGSLEAADQLGEYFLEKWRGKRNSQDRMWAREWLSLGLQEALLDDRVESNSQGHHYKIVFFIAPSHVLCVNLERLGLSSHLILARTVKSVVSSYPIHTRLTITPSHKVFMGTNELPLLHTIDSREIRCEPYHTPEWALRDQDDYEARKCEKEARDYGHSTGYRLDATTEKYILQVPVENRKRYAANPIYGELPESEKPQVPERAEPGWRRRILDTVGRILGAGKQRTSTGGVKPVGSGGPTVPATPEFSQTPP